MQKLLVWEAMRRTVPPRGDSRHRIPPTSRGRHAYRSIGQSRVRARHAHTVRSMDPVRNPYAPGAGQRPPELAGRDEQLAAFDVTLERVAHGRPERSVVLTGLRGVGKTVLLNALRSAAVRADWGTGKLEARPDQPLRRPLASALHMAIRELGTSAVGRGARDGEGVRGPRHRLRPHARPLESRHRRPGHDRTSGLRRHGDRPRRAAHRRRRPGGRRGSRGGDVRRRDAGPAARGRVGALRGLPRAVPEPAAGGRRRRRSAAPAGGAEREQVLQRAAVPLQPRRPARPRGRGPGAGLAGARGGRRVHARGARRDVCGDGGLPLLRPGLRQGGLGRGGRVAGHAGRRRGSAAPEAEAELGVGFFGSRYERATPAEREYLRAMAETAVPRPRRASPNPTRCRPQPSPRTWTASRSRSRPRGMPCSRRA